MVIHSDGFNDHQIRKYWIFLQNCYHKTVKGPPMTVILAILNENDRQSLREGRSFSVWWFDAICIPRAIQDITSEIKPIKVSTSISIPPFSEWNSPEKAAIPSPEVLTADRRTTATVMVIHYRFYPVERVSLSSRLVLCSFPVPRTHFSRSRV